MYMYLAGFFRRYAHSDSAFQEIACLHVCDMQRKGQRIHFQRPADGVLILRAGKAHVPADRHCFLLAQMHEELDQEHGLFAVSVGQAVVDLVIGHLSQTPFSFLALR